MQQNQESELLPFLGRRYQHVRWLGEGAQGAVHLVRDRFLGGRLVAVKMLRPQATEKWHTAFRHEFEVLAGLRHPRLSQVHDFGTTEDSRVYFTRDYVAGDDLRAATSQIDIESLVALFVEICRALKPLHRRGLVHGDLKPGNIICSPDGMAHLIDFSFVRASGEDAMRRGTVQYMAPEVIEGRACDVRADLYALGATVFDIVSGAPLFDGSVAEVVTGHLGEARPVLALGRVISQTPRSKKVIDGLKEITARLIAKQPDDRFPDIVEVEAALTALCPQVVAPDPLPDYPVISEIAGRDRELRRIREAILERFEVPSDKLSLWMIQGELGTGKSSLLRGIKWWAELGSIQVLEARCGGGGGLLRPIAELVDQALGLIEMGKAAIAVGEHLLASLSQPGTAGTHLDDLMQETIRLLLGAAKHKQLIVVIDDVEQASPETLKVIRGLTAAIGTNDSIVFIVASDESFPLSKKLGRAEKIQLPVLGREQVIPLVESFLGRAEPKVVERVIAHTGGNPLFVTTLLQDLAASGEGAERLERLGPPRQLEAYWRERLTTLSKKERQLVEAASVLARPAEPQELARVAGIEDQALAQTLSALENDGWIRFGIQGWHVTTAPLRSEILAAAVSDGLTDYHRRAIKNEPDEARQLYHAACSGEVDMVRAKGRKMAQSLERLGALQAARELLTAMGKVFKGKTEAASVILDLGRICLAQGDYPAAEEYLTPLIDSQSIEIQRSATLLLGGLHNTRGELDHAADFLNQVLTIGGAFSDEAQAFRELANVEFKRGDLEACTASAEKGLDRAPPNDPVRVDLLGVLANANAQAGRHDEALARAREAVSEARLTGDKRSLAQAIRILAWVRQLSGDLEGAVEELEQAVTLNREFGDLPRLLRDQLVLGDLKWWLEDWYEALIHYEEAMRLAGAVANPVQDLLAQIGLGQALVKVGRFERAMLIIGGAEQEAIRLGEEELRIKTLFYQADLIAARGKVGDAIERYEEARKGLNRLCRQETFAEHDTEKVGWLRRQAILAELELEMAGWMLWRNGKNDLDTAKALIAEAAEREREEEGRLYEETLQLRQGMLLIAQDQFEQGNALLDDLVDRAREGGPTDIAWQAHLVSARGYLARGSDFLARRRLRQAEEILEKLAHGFPKEQRLAFWQDVRRAEVRRLLTSTTPSSNFSSSTLIGLTEAEVDPEARDLYRVLEFNKQLSAEHDLDRLLKGILDAAVELTGAERGLVLLAEEKEGASSLEIRAGSDYKDAHERFSRSIAESVHMDGEPVVTVDAMGDDRFNEFLSIHELRLKSVACLPVRYRGQALGVLYLENRFRRGRFGGRDLRVLAAFADQVAIAISQARLLDEARKRQAQLEDARQVIEEAYTRQAEDLSSKKTDLKFTRERLERVRRQLEGEGDYHGVIGTGAVMSRVFSLVERVKDLDVPVVFVGESGTGKDLLARVLHDQGCRRDGPFVVTNCGSVPDTLVEATLFGHVTGAFSGAASDQQGILHAANRGTLYLDEIGDMSPRMQVDLLRVLQEGSYSPLGSAHTIHVDVRLVASSKVPLETLVESGRLRQDLLYRLQVVTVDIPPLRQRTEDILILARRILSREASQAGQTKRVLSKNAAKAIVAHAWPGNVRELEQTIRRILVIGEGQGAIETAEFFGERLPQKGLPIAAKRPRQRTGIDQDEESRVLAALERCQWNRTRAAEELGIPRRTFYRKLGKLGLLKKK